MIIQKKILRLSQFLQKWFIGLVLSGIILYTVNVASKDGAELQIQRNYKRKDVIMKKRTLLVLLALAASAVLCACGDKEETVVATVEEIPIVEETTAEEETTTEVALED